jgi:hypothetical protein
MKLKGCFEDNQLTSEAFNKYFQNSPKEVKFKKSA